MPYSLFVNMRQLRSNCNVDNRKWKKVPDPFFFFFPFRKAFSLIEILVVISIIALLVSILLPMVASAREMARAAKVHAELYGLAIALEIYAPDHEGVYPPMRVDCNTNLRNHWCQLPVELADEGYIPKGPPNGGLAAEVEDEFHPGFTYKYARMGRPYFDNGELRYDQDYPALWIPDDFPVCRSETGKLSGDDAFVSHQPMIWMLWSLGPEPDSVKSKSKQAPLKVATWYTRPGDTGVLVRYMADGGIQYKSP